MTQLLTYPDIDPQQWQALIDRSPYATWFQTKEAYEFYASLPEEMTPFAVGVVEASPKSSPKGKDFQPTPNPFNLPILNPSLEGRTLDTTEQSPFPSGEGRGEANFAQVWGAHTADSTQYDLLKENAVKNRKNPTEAESVLWDMLKGNKIGYHFRRQHIILDYIVDFICLDKGLIIELDGGYHDDPQQKEYDKARTAHLQRLGYTELRFKNEELLCNPDAVIQKITGTLNNLPSLQGRVGDRLVGVIVGYITRERNPIKQLLTCRSIIIGGPLLDEHINNEALSALLSAIAQCKVEGLKFKGTENSIAETTASSPHRLASDSDHASTPYTLPPTPIFIETRNFHDYSRWKEVFKRAGFAYQPHLNYHINTTSLDQVQSRIGKHRWRYIRLSMRDGAQIVAHPTLEQVRAFYTILQDLYRTKVRTPLWSWEFFERLFHTEHARYILVELDGKIVGGTACVCLPGKAVYEWYACGLDNCRDDIRPLSVAIWGEMQYAAENGYPLFDFMGAGTPDQPYGVRDFKAEFGGVLVEHGRFLCIRKPLLYWIGKMGVKWLKRRINK